MPANSVDRAYARANLYRFLSLGFAYPTTDIHDELIRGIEPALLAADVISGDVANLVGATATALRARNRRGLASDYRKTFTFSASPDCPLNECAYGAKHIYQEVQELADIAGFYTAFGLEIAGERPDELAAELEFCAVLALKEGIARERGEREKATVCRSGSRLFLHDHLGRWAENVGRRIAILAPESGYAPLGRLLEAFVRFDIEATRAAPIDRYEESPQPPEAIEDDGCPAEEGLGELASDYQDDFIGVLTPVGGQEKGSH